MGGAVDAGEEETPAVPEMAAMRRVVGICLAGVAKLVLQGMSGELVEMFFRGP